MPEAVAEHGQTYDVLGVPISAVSLETAAQRIALWKGDRVGRSVGVRDVASLMAIRSDTDKLETSKRTSMNIPDGMPLVWIGKLKGYNVQRTCGPDLMEKMLLESGRTGLKHFFYGGKEGVADTLAEKYREKVSEIQIVGTCCPPFRELTPEENEAVVEQIRQSGADIVWVGMSSPKQDIWMDEHLDSIPATMIGVGAAFDFHSGAVRRAPKVMQRLGFEFAFRLASEPKRLWRRYLVVAPVFVGLVLWQLLSHTAKKIFNLQSFSKS